jgi:glutathione S-transferase
LTLTALDLNNEVHDSVSLFDAHWQSPFDRISQHHPIAVSLYYEDQKEESARKSKNIREERIPKFLGYFANVLQANSQNGVLVGSKISYADLAVFQVVDGLQFAFPKRMKALEQKSEYKPVFDLKKKIEGSEGIAAYLKSDRRQKYSMGVFVRTPF